jgi:uncharacterized low-complexity protein
MRRRRRRRQMIAPGLLPDRPIDVPIVVRPTAQGPRGLRARRRGHDIPGGQPEFTGARCAHGTVLDPVSRLCRRALAAAGPGRSVAHRHVRAGPHAVEASGRGGVSLDRAGAGALRHPRSTRAASGRTGAIGRCPATASRRSPGPGGRGRCGARRRGRIGVTRCSTRRWVPICARLRAFMERASA